MDVTDFYIVMYNRNLFRRIAVGVGDHCFVISIMQAPLSRLDLLLQSSLKAIGWGCIIGCKHVSLERRISCKSWGLQRDEVVL